VWLSPEFRDWSIKSAIEHVRCPVLAIHGDNDEYGSSAFPKFIAKNSGGPTDMLIIKNCGHMPNKEKQKEVIGATLSFLSNIV